ncbi:MULTISPECIES: hypothetical protein [unclassified Mesorhizobium]|uniref:hypothetical protein n=1 Tax=unclassified Mesorhizobium TaxID=325217 RepID=UPI001FED8C68|nr:MULTISPECIES: hypothetical protein [unclassified Mesorhizobium]
MQAIDQMKPTISRAMATLTTLAFLPRALKRRYRVQSRTCAFHPISRTTFGSTSIRSTLCRPMRGLILYAQAPSTSARRAWVLPVLVMPPRQTV